MPDERPVSADSSADRPRDPLAELVRAGVETLRAKLDEQPMHPHVFDELSVAASALYKACSALEPVVTLPNIRRSGEPLAPAPATEGAGARMARELVGAVQELVGRRGEPKSSRKDLMAAIAVAEEAGLEEDADRLRTELFGEEEEIPDEDLPPKLKVDRAEELIAKSTALSQRARGMLESVKPDQIVDAKSWDARLKIGCIARINGKEYSIRDQEHLKASIESGAEFVRDGSGVG